MEKFFRCLHSMFFYLTYDKVKEIIILDNGSHKQELLDYLRAIDDGFEKVNVIFSNENLGIGKGRKKLFDMATGDYIISIDSDVIVVNPPLLLSTIEHVLNMEDMYLTGGGGGDHPYFPTIEKEHIINKPTPDEGAITYVDEVAGWFTAFKSENLVKNGGKLYMDEQFSPFWAEDSDFSIQVKTLGKKSCILGKNLIAHAWSSSHKPETLTTVAGMWEKLRNKWYKNKPEFREIVVDEAFQKSFYDRKDEYISTNWFVKGIMEDRLANTDFLKVLYPELTFNNEVGVVSHNGEELDIKNFVEEHVTARHVMDSCLTVVEDSLKQCKTLTLLQSFDVEKTLHVLEKCETLHDLNIVLLLHGEHDQTRVVSKVKQLTQNVRIYSVKHLVHRFKLMANLLVTELRGVEFENFLHLTSETSDTFLDELDLDFTHYQSNEKEADLNCIELITDVLKVDKSMTYPDNCDFFIPKHDLFKLLDSIPFQKLLKKTLLFEHDVPMHVIPRTSPEHSLQRLFGYLQHHVEGDTLMVMIAEINDEQHLTEVKDLITRFRERPVDVMLVNTGSMHKIKMSRVGVDYYYNIKTEDNKFVTWLKMLSTVELNDYTNFILSTTDYELEPDDDIASFMDAAKYKSVGYMSENEHIKSILFSICRLDIVQFNQMVNQALELNKKKPENDIDETLERSLPKLNMKVMIEM